MRCSVNALFRRLVLYGDDIADAGSQYICIMYFFIVVPAYEQQVYTGQVGCIGQVNATDTVRVSECFKVECVLVVNISQYA